MKPRMFFVIFWAAIALPSFAQRVKRKGVEPVQINQKKEKTLQFTIAQFTGKWMELSRADAAGKTMAFSDTIFFEITADAKATIKQGNHSRMVGEAAIESPGNELLLVTDAFTIQKLETDKLWLMDDENGLHYFEKQTAFWMETMTQQTIAEQVFVQPIEISLQKLVGTWSVYRKQSKPGAATGVVLVNRVEISAINETSGKGLVVVTQNEKTVQLTASFLWQNQQLVATLQDGQTLHWQVYQLTEKEWVFGDATTVLQYAKRL